MAERGIDAIGIDGAEPNDESELAITADYRPRKPCFAAYGYACATPKVAVAMHRRIVAVCASS